MGMHIDETGAHDAPRNVDPPARVSRRQVTHRDNSAGAEPNVSLISRAAGAVDDLSTRENEHYQITDRPVCGRRPRGSYIHHMQGRRCLTQLRTRRWLQRELIEADRHRVKQPAPSASARGRYAGARGD